MLERAGRSEQKTATRGRHEEIIKAGEEKRKKECGMEEGSDKEAGGGDMEAPTTAAEGTLLILRSLVPAQKHCAHKQKQYKLFCVVFSSVFWSVADLFHAPTGFMMPCSREKNPKTTDEGLVTSWHQGCVSVKNKGAFYC